MISAAVIFLSAITMSQACVPTATTTTTTPCCPMLTSANLPRTTPSVATQQQCSILRRVSSTCPVDGIVICDAAPDTNPTAILIELFNGVTLARSQSVTGSPATSVTVRVICVNGVWRVPTATGSTTSTPITQVSCSQSGSQGADRGYVLGSAL